MTGLSVPSISISVWFTTSYWSSKFGCEIDKVVFYNNLNKDKIWDEFDVLLTANPDLLKEDNNGKLNMSKPCQGCQSLLEQFNIKEVWYSDFKGQIVKNIW